MYRHSFCLRCCASIDLVEFNLVISSFLDLQAVKVYSKALCLFPDFKEANVNVAQSYKELGMLPEALKHFDKVLT